MPADTVEDRGVTRPQTGRPVKTVPAHFITMNDVANPRARDGRGFHVHKANCADLRKYTGWNGERVPEAQEDAYIEVAALKDLVEEIYRYGGGFYDENGIPAEEHEDAWKRPEYREDFHVFPCVKLPDEPQYID